MHEAKTDITGPEPPYSDKERKILVDEINKIIQAGYVDPMKLARSFLDDLGFLLNGKTGLLELNPSYDPQIVHESHEFDYNLGMSDPIVDEDIEDDDDDEDELEEFEDEDEDANAILAEDNANSHNTNEDGP